MEMRRMSATQSLASALSDASVRLLPHPYHWIPCVLMPRSCIGEPYWLHSLVPQTLSFPFFCTGVCASVAVTLSITDRATMLQVLNRISGFSVFIWIVFSVQ